MKNRLTVMFVEGVEKISTTLGKYEGYIWLFMLAWLLCKLYMPMPGEGECRNL